MSISTISPPALSEERLETLYNQIKDYQITHGSLIKLLPGINHDEDSQIQSIPIGASMFPTPWPRHLYDQAAGLQHIFNVLYMRVAEDDEWLGEVLQDLRQSDTFTQKLWSIWEAVKTEQMNQEILTLGLFRSDYMLHDEVGEGEDLEIRQVELNTFSIAGGTHGNIVGDMHRFLCKTGAFRDENDSGSSITLDQLPSNDTVKGLVSGLRAAHEAYGPTKSSGASYTAVLMVVQPNNINVCDERPLEYALWDQDPVIPCYRAIFSNEVLERTKLTHDNCLLYRPPHSSELVEISVVYLRAGYDAHEYSDSGIKARLLLERSRAIKCPSILGHLATFKKVQQALCMPGAVERFLPDDQATAVRATFSNMLPLDADSQEGRAGRAIVGDEALAIDYILKPSLEGGGHNVYGTKIVPYLAGIDESQWAQYILMQEIRPPAIDNVLLTTRGEYQGQVVSELGIFGSCLWKVRRHGGPAKIEILRNENIGWSFKTKAGMVDEMSVVKGYGCFDCPRLI